VKTRIQESLLNYYYNFKFLFNHILFWNYCWSGQDSKRDTLRFLKAAQALLSTNGI